ncbi:MAG TPA: YcxB family protein [Gemmatimonadaceae bacterium]|nr:YcxB family protein [Gemmatimonadaceae bacterium]
MESSSLRFQIDPSREESQRACAAMVRACLPPSRRDLILLALYVAVGVAAFYFTPDTTATTFLIGMLAITAAVIAIEVEGRLRVRHLRTADPHAEETHFVELNAEGVRSWCAHVDARYPWRDFSKVAEDKEFYLLLRLSGAGSAIPKRLLDRVTDAQLRARIREWSPDRGASLTPELE